jgi:hypothetical protein
MSGLFTQSAAQNDTCGVVILNEVKDLILKLSHYHSFQSSAVSRQTDSEGESINDK